MVVQHNLTAMNANRNFGITTASQAKSTEKLSSGYKINRAADDAAGLSISEKMRKQVRGLTQAVANAQDGVSCVQTAEGALTEVHDMLQRMNELAVKASNGTMSSDDRTYVTDEIAQLQTEIDRVSTTTKFNETYLLNTAQTISLQVGAEGTSDNTIGVALSKLDKSGCCVGSISVNTATNAKNAISAIAAGITAVSKQRSALGAAQNRLEHTINNLNNVVENTTAAESNIRDTDMATEMVRYSNNNILAQAGQAMLAQANQANQGVLSLLQ